MRRWANRMWECVRTLRLEECTTTPGPLGDYGERGVSTAKLYGFLFRDLIHGLHRAHDELQRRVDKAHSETTTSRRDSKRRSAPAEDKLQRRDPWADGYTGHDTDRDRRPMARPVCRGWPGSAYGPEQVEQLTQGGMRNSGSRFDLQKPTLTPPIARQSLSGRERASKKSGSATDITEENVLVGRQPITPHPTHT